MSNEKRLEERPLCRGGIKTDNPCWRPAVELHFPSDEEPTLCAEHARLIHCDKEATAWRYALEVIEKWVDGPVSEDPYGHLDRLATNMRDEVRREYARSAAETHVAEKVAQHGPPNEGESSLTLEQEEELARLITRADSFVDARTLLEDAPDEVVERRDRWVIVDALDTAAMEAGEKCDRYKEELGLK